MAAGIFGGIKAVFQPEDRERRRRVDSHRGAGLQLIGLARLHQGHRISFSSVTAPGPSPPLTPFFRAGSSAAQAHSEPDADFDKPSSLIEHIAQSAAHRKMEP